MAKLIIVCILGVGALVALIFACIFLAQLISESVREKRNNQENAEAEDADAKKEEVEEIDLDEVLAALEKRSNEADQEEKEEAKEEPAKEEVKEEKKEEKAPVVIVVNNNTTTENADDLDYETRLAKAREAFEKLEKDYNKNTKSLNKYARTEKKKARNEKLLNKKAAELASLNLSVYNVKDLKDVDPDKKARQDELVTHVAELKSAIMEAEEYLEANKEKHAQEEKLNIYLEKEYKRYQEEIKSLEEFLKKNGTDAQ